MGDRHILKLTRQPWRAAVCRMKEDWEQTRNTNEWTFEGRTQKFTSRTLARHRILGGPLRGSAIVTSWHDYPAAILGKTELALLKWFGKNVGEGETWLDIGAHYGYISIALCKLVGSAGRVYAF